MYSVQVQPLAGPIKWNRHSVTIRSVFQNPVAYYCIVYITIQNWKQPEERVKRAGRKRRCLIFDIKLEWILSITVTHLYILGFKNIFIYVVIVFLISVYIQYLNLLSIFPFILQQLILSGYKCVYLYVILLGFFLHLVIMDFPPDCELATHFLNHLYTFTLCCVLYQYLAILSLLSHLVNYSVYFIPL